MLHAGQYAYDGRKLKKRDFKTLWIIRLNAAVRTMGLNYNQFIHKLSQKKLNWIARYYLKLQSNILPSSPKS